MVSGTVVDCSDETFLGEKWRPDRTPDETQRKLTSCCPDRYRVLVVFDTSEYSISDGNRNGDDRKQVRSISATKKLPKYLDCNMMPEKQNLGMNRAQTFV